MTQEVNYGSLTKRIVFTSSDHQHAKLINRLRFDGLTQAHFFRSIISGYLSGDERIQGYIDDIKDQSKDKKAKTKKLRTTGNKKIKEMGLSEDQIGNLFDIIAEEFPDL